MKKIILIAIVMLGAFGCKDATQEEKQKKQTEITKPDEEGPTIEDFCLFESLYAMAHYANGIDLLNPSNADALKNIKMFRLVSGVEIPIYDKNMYHKEGFMVIAPVHNSVEYKQKALSKAWAINIPMYGNTKLTGSEKVMYDQFYESDYVITESAMKIKWTDTDSDIIRAEFKHLLPKHTKRLHKVFVNGELKWESESKWGEFYIFEKILK